MLIYKWGSPSSFLSYKRLKLKLRVFLAGQIVAMVTYCATKLTATCSLMIGQFVDTMMLASTSRVVIITHQSTRNCCQPPNLRKRSLNWSNLKTAVLRFSMNRNNYGNEAFGKLPIFLKQTQND